MKYILIRIANGLAWGMVTLGYIILVPTIIVGLSEKDMFPLIFPGAIISLGIGGIVFINKKYNTLLTKNLKTSSGMKVAGYIISAFGALYSFAGLVEFIIGIFLFSTAKDPYLFPLIAFLGVFLPGVAMIMGGIFIAKMHNPAVD